MIGHRDHRLGEHHPVVDDLNLDDHHGYVMVDHHRDVDDLHQYHPFEDRMSVVRWAENRLGAGDEGRDLEKAFVVF